jgi:hypothetical protein
MERKLIWTIVIGIILFVAVFFVLIDRLPQSSQSTTSQANLPITSVTAISSDPIVGIWQLIGEDGSVLVKSTFFSDGRFSGAITDPETKNAYISGTWSKVRENEYLITCSDGSTMAFVYNPKTDTVSDSGYPDVPNYRPGKEPSRTYTSTPVSTPVRTQPPSETTSSSLKYSGNEDDIKGFSVQGGGGFIVTGSNSGRSNFIVHITDSSGSVVEFLFNEIGPYYGRKVIHLDAGKYFLEVQAEGSWSIDISST